MGEQLTEVHIYIIYRIPEKKIGKVYFIKIPSSILNISLDLKRKKKRRLQYNLSLLAFKNFNFFQQEDALLTNNKDILENCFTFANIFINMLFKDGIKAT